MGRGTILSSAGEGRYTINLDFGQDILDARIASLQTVIDRLDGELPNLENALSAAQSVVALAIADQDSAISAFKAKLLSGEDSAVERRAVEEATEQLISVTIVRDDARRRLDLHKATRTTAQSRLAYYQGFSLTRTTSAWCVDYTTDATGDVATIEVPGEPDAVLIVPGGDAPTSLDGEVRDRVAHEAHQLYLNLSILPGWQKWAPTFRFGQITEIDRLNDTCNVTLEAATSSEQSIDINQTGSLSDVPIEYMSCDSAAFEVFDDIVVKFEGQNWNNPKVIGFKDHPRPCAPAQIAFLLETSGDPYIVSSVSRPQYGHEQSYMTPDGPTPRYYVNSPPGGAFENPLSYSRTTWIDLVLPQSWEFIEGQTIFDNTFGGYSPIDTYTSAKEHEDIKIRFDRAIIAERLNANPSIWRTGFNTFSSTLDVQGQDSELVLPCIGPVDTGFSLILRGMRKRLPYELEHVQNPEGELYTAIGRKNVEQMLWPWGQFGDPTVDYSSEFSAEFSAAWTNPPSTLNIVFDGKSVSYTLRYFGSPAQYGGLPNIYFDNTDWKQNHTATYIRTDLLDQI